MLNKLLSQNSIKACMLCMYRYLRPMGQNTNMLKADMPL